ncbi:DNA polymerase III beta subunit [Dissulfuribacter thermophilus]|uniref:Beta sliding clamp n=1 Tax=Dissulfuribacter thermophilus TaxID=1156395 RepID=A0A1B9F5U3_9BACT|nr:DNA polymerase III subunit beta [Dissulfuribacter thermophilus]OCC15318.1 DNA polymerase III beta subunit [Dissulfuribacter thermophilus]
MKIYTDAKELSKILKSLDWKMPRYSQAILDYALISCDDQGIHIMRKDLNIFLSHKISGEIEKQGEVLVPVKKVLTVLGTCKEQIPLEYDGDYLRMGNYVLDTVPAHTEDYPKIPEEKFREIGVIKGHALAYAIEKCNPFLGDPDKYTLHHFSFGHYGHMASSDSHRICQVPLEIDCQLVVHNTLAYLKKINLEGDLKIAHSDKHIRIKGNNFVAYISLIDGQYPPYKEVIPSKGVPLRVNADDLIATLKEAVAYCKAATKEKDFVPVIIHWLQDGIKVVGNFSSEHRFEKMLSTAFSQIPVSVPLNVPYLLQALKGLTGEIIIWYAGDDKPFIITDGVTYRYIQMPVNIEREEKNEYYELPKDTPLQEIPYSPDPSAIPEPTRKKAGSRKRTVKKAAKPSNKKASSEQEAQGKALAELKKRLDFWEAEALKKEEHIRNLEAELAKLQESYRALLQFQALRPNGKGRYAVIDGHQYLFSQGKILDKDGNEVGHYNRKGGEINGQPFKLQQEWVVAMN